jgi:hypothetical protein
MKSSALLPHLRLFLGGSRSVELPGDLLRRSRGKAMLNTMRACLARSVEAAVLGTMLAFLTDTIEDDSGAVTVAQRCCLL